MYIESITLPTNSKENFKLLVCQVHNLRIHAILVGQTDRALRAAGAQKVVEETRVGDALALFVANHGRQLVRVADEDEFGRERDRSENGRLEQLRGLVDDANVEFDRREQRVGAGDARRAVDFDFVELRAQCIGVFAFFNDVRY